MPNCPGVNHRRAIHAFMKMGYWVEREGRHVIMTNGTVDLVIPRNNPINGYTMGGLIVRAGLTVPQFRDLL